MPTTAFEQYLAGLTASWEALAVPRPEAFVRRGNGFIAARFAETLLNNAVVLHPEAIAPAEAVYTGVTEYALWSRDPLTAAALAQRGYQPSESTLPMLCHLDAVLAVAGPQVHTDADPERIAQLNGVAPYILCGVPGLRAYATDGYESGLVTSRADLDVNVSFVYTVPPSRGQGLAAAVLSAALLDSRARGARTASLQSTSMAERLYARAGFHPVGRWQEWTPVS